MAAKGGGGGRAGRGDGGDGGGLTPGSYSYNLARYGMSSNFNLPRAGRSIRANTLGVGDWIVIPNGPRGTVDQVTRSGVRLLTGAGVRTQTIKFSNLGGGEVRRAQGGYIYGISG